MAIKKFYTIQEINSLTDKVISYQRTIDTFTDQIRYYSNYSVFKKLVDEAIKQGEELIELLDYLLRDTETIMKLSCHNDIKEALTTNKEIEETADKIIIDKKNFIPMTKREREEIKKLWLNFLETQKNKDIRNKHFDYIEIIGKRAKEDKDDIMDEMKVL